jgi:serine/threonine-protein kinase
MESKSPAQKAAGPPTSGGQQEVTAGPNLAETAAFQASDSDAGAMLLEDTQDKASATATAAPQNQATAAFEMEKPAAKPVAKPTAAPKQTATNTGAAAKTAGAAATATAGGQKVVTLGDYRLIKKLGQGGMGAVYLAHQISLDRDVALKVMSKELASNEAFVKRFQREARVMAKLDHPNILRCYEVNQAQGVHYLSVEFVEGGSIGDLLEKKGKFSLGDSLYIILTCAQALQHAHELNVIHRDIKPDNILLTKKGIVKVADLGLGKAMDDDLGLTKTGAGAGTPLYMAPEQARDAKHVDQRSDIYALGCMLYKFLTSQFPFTGETLVEVIEAKEKNKFTPVRQHNADVPEKLSLMIDKMLQAKPEHRYQNCAQVILALESLGLANRKLSWIQADGPAAKALTPPPPRKQVSVKALTSSPKSGAAGTAAAPADDFWYASFTDKSGKAVTRKMTAQEVLAHVRNKVFTADTQLSRTLKGGYRALGTYTEFQHLIKAAVTTDKANRKAEKFKSFYAQIDKEEKRRQRWRWLHNMFLSAGGFVGFLLWIAVVMGVLVGLYYLGVWLVPILRDKFFG